MPSMKEKAFLGLLILFVAVLAANFVLPVWTYEVRLVTSPAADSIYVPAGEPFNVTCRGSGGSDGKFSSMKWLNTEGDVIPDGVPGVQKEGSNALSLIFTNPKVDESGVYKCVAVYDATHSLEKLVKITFFGAEPSFESNYEDVTAEEGSIVKFYCLANGDRPMTYEWYKYDEKISENTNSFIRVLSSGHESSLVISNVDRSHNGVYTCKASNQHGLTSKLYELTVLPSSRNDTDNGTSSIVNVEVLNVTSNSVLFNIETTEPASFIEVKYNEARDSTEYTKKWNYGDNYEVTDLIPGGLYSFRFRTEEDDWSEAYNVTLLPGRPDVILQNLENGNVKLQWQRNFDDYMRGTIDKYELTYFTVQMEKGNKWVASNCAITIQIPYCAGSSYTISGLGKDLYYEIQLRIHTASGYGEPYSQKIFFPK